MYFNYCILRYKQLKIFHVISFIIYIIVQYYEIIKSTF